MLYYDPKNDILRHWTGWHARTRLADDKILTTWRDQLRRQYLEIRCLGRDTQTARMIRHTIYMKLSILLQEMHKRKEKQDA